MFKAQKILEHDKSLTVCPFLDVHYSLLVQVVKVRIWG